MATPLLSIRNLHIERNGLLTLDLPALDVYQGEVLAVIGPNGAGKTTLMMAISGLIPVSGGEIRFAGQPVVPHKDLGYRRKLAIVMQAPLLLRASVRENVASGLKFRRVKPDEIRARVRDWLARLSIAGLEARPAHQISVGEEQRVSLARAFVLQPDLLLLDEPFSALDAPTRAQLLIDLKKQLAETHLTTVFITHDLDEAVSLADRVAILMNGRLRQIGSPAEIFQTPSDVEIARFTGAETIIPGQVRCQREGQVEVDCGAFTLRARSDALVGSRVVLCLRPEDVEVKLDDSLNGSDPENSLPGRVQMLVPSGPMVRISVHGPVDLTALMTRTVVLDLGLREGQPVVATIPVRAIHVLPA